MKKPAQHLIAEVPRRQTRVELTIDVDLDDVRSHYCTLNQGGEVVERSRFRTTPKAIGKWFTAYRWIGFTFMPPRNARCPVIANCESHVMPIQSADA
jgi:hypothetical protein